MEHHKDQQPTKFEALNLDNFKYFYISVPRCECERDSDCQRGFDCDVNECKCIKKPFIENVVDCDPEDDECREGKC